MATKTKKQNGKRGGGGAERAPAAQREHAGLNTPPPPPRLKVHYETTVRPRLQQQFGFTNVHQIPRLTKIVLNVGLG